MKHKFTINHKAFTIVGCILAVVLFIVSCVSSAPEPGSSNYEAASQVMDKDLDLFQ